MVGFGEKLKKLRTAKGMTQQQLAERMGITKSVVSAYENGIRLPSYDILGKIVRIFGVTSDYLLGFDHDCKINMNGLDEDEILILAGIAEKFRKNKC